MSNRTGRSGKFRVFVRDWWRKDATGNPVPNSGDPGRTIGYADTADEARRMCAERNAGRKPDWRGTKAEFTQVHS